MVCNYASGLDALCLQAVRPSVQAILVSAISQERFEGFSSNFAQMSTLTQG